MFRPLPIPLLVRFRAAEQHRPHRDREADCGTRRQHADGRGHRHADRGAEE
jgi:hypothetical protein